MKYCREDATSMVLGFLHDGWFRSFPNLHFAEKFRQCFMVDTNTSDSHVPRDVMWCDKLLQLHRTLSHWRWEVVKHLQKNCKNVLEPLTSHGYAVDVKVLYKCFILHATTYYLQHAFNMLKHLQNYLANYLQHFCKCFGTKNTKDLHKCFSVLFYT